MKDLLSRPVIASTAVYTIYSSIINCSEWENAGSCIAEGNQVLGTRKQTLSFRNYKETREVECYKHKKKGNTGSGAHYYIITVI